MQNLQSEDGSRVYSFEEWLASYPEASTQRLYTKGTQAFLRAVYKSSESAEVLAPRYIRETNERKRSYFKDMLTYISTSTSAPTTLVVYTSIARSFLLYCCGIEMNKKEARMIKGHMPKGTRPRTHKDDITWEILRAILSHCDVKMKALVLLLLSSGIRVGEALQLKLSDVPLDTFPQVVNVRGEYAKEGDSYRSYISSEAKEALVEWLKVREEYIKGSAYRIGNLKKRKFRPWTRSSSKPSAEDTIFPFSYGIANAAFTKALKAAKLLSRDESTRIKSIRIHDLRKYFLTEIKTKIPSEVAEAMAGHLKGLQAAYTRYSAKELAEFYVKGETALLVNQDSAKLDHLTEQVDKKDKQVTDLMAYNIQLQGDIRKFEDWMAKVETFMKNLPQLLELKGVEEIMMLDEATVELTPRQDTKSPVKKRAG